MLKICSYGKVATFLPAAQDAYSVAKLLNAGEVS